MIVSIYMLGWSQLIILNGLLLGGSRSMVKLVQTNLLFDLLTNLWSIIYRYGTSVKHSKANFAK